ncbi:MAG: WYL domain-containing protein [Sulfurimonadaceae bacterium]
MEKSYDKTLSRLIMILHKLDQDERPTQQELADEFNVSIRTIQRDINRLHYFSIEKNRDGTLQFVKGFSLKRTSFEDMEMMLVYLSLSMVTDISPEFSKSANTLISKLLLPNYFSPYLIKQDPFEPIDVDSKLMNEIEFAIKNSRISRLQFNEKKIEVEPYKIVSFDEIWYLFAKEVESEKVKTYFISDIKSLEILQSTYKLERPIDEVLAHVHTACFEDGVQYKVTIKVLEPIAHYFKRKKHLVSQELIEEGGDGSLIISFLVSNDEEVDNIIKSWLPHVEVLTPIRLRHKIKTELEAYVEMLKRSDE